jgi:hypothetical protein
VNLLVNTVQSTEDWFVGIGTVAYEFATSSFPITVTHYGCCRLSSLQESNNDNSWYIRSTINIASQTVGPSTTSLPRIYLAINQPASFRIPASPGDGYANYFYFNPTATSGLNQPRPCSQQSFCLSGCSCYGTNAGNCASCMSIATDGQISWTPARNGLYAVQVLLVLLFFFLFNSISLFSSFVALLFRSICRLICSSLLPLFLLCSSQLNLATKPARP